jgi:hypothetical protein
MTPLYAVMESVGEKHVYTLTEAPLGKGIVKPSDNAPSNITRLGDCIECVYASALVLLLPVMRNT